MDKILGCKNRGLSSCLRWTEPALKLTGVERIAFRGILWFGVVVIRWKYSISNKTCWGYEQDRQR
ncbi:hypothetical protein NC653_014151 [Populus alba x Populus x berolinensis]|uniref:Uncharacterized protein n=1 Tax=Populus alba x Populus x berolinensis TaxID=444605 RepID=A0AAD6QWI3_9ROSI|nr:hypothetical protein NC653_014151 [Populus alba x Populus x berolinensis]